MHNHQPKHIPLSAEIRQRFHDYYQQLKASMQTLHLDMPLLLLEHDGGGYEILNGHSRIQVLRDKTLASIPCLLIRFLTPEDNHERP